MITWETERYVESLSGSSIVALRRIFFTFQGIPQTSVGPIEMTLHDGRFCTLDSAGDGESLNAANRKWIDPFVEPLSDANREFIEESGKWSAYDVSHRSPYNMIIDKTIEIQKIIKSKNKRMIGVDFSVEGIFILRCVVHFDDLYVEIIDE